MLCFGDSNTRGYVAGSGERHGAGVRWPLRLEALLAPQVRVVEEGLNGRTTVFEEPARDGRSGAAMLPLLLQSHAPLAAVIVMLGTNDMKHVHGANACEAARGTAVLLDIVAGSQAGEGAVAPSVLLVAPAPIGPLTGAVAEEYPGGESESRRLAPLLLDLARQRRTAFVDAGAHVQPSPIDGVHLDEHGHCRLAEVLAPPLAALLAR